MKLRVLAMALALLAFFMFVGAPFGQSAKAIAGVDDSILLIILAALAAMGISFSMTGGIRTVLSWLSDTIDEAGLDFSNIRYGANKQGQILLDNRFLILISTLALYIQAKLSLTNNSSVVISQSGTIAGLVYAYRLPLEFTSNNGSRYIMLSTNPDAYVFFIYAGSPNGVRPVVFAYGDTNFTYMRYESWGDVNRTGSSRQINGGCYYWDPNYINIEGGNTTYSNAFNGVIIHSYELTASTVGQFLMDNVFGTGIQQTHDLTAIGGYIDIPSGADLEDKGGILTIPVDWGETLPGAISQIPGLVLEGELAGNTNLDLEDEAEVADQVDVEATNAIIVSQNPADYQVGGLSSVFPFCIPFDIYNFFECLAADPVAPSFDWRFYVPGICDETIEIDLSEFNTAAQILRTMELLAFCVGLAFVTRKILRG